MTRLDYFFVVHAPKGHYHYDQRTYGPMKRNPDGNGVYGPPSHHYKELIIGYYTLVYGRHHNNIKWEEPKGTTHRDLCPASHLKHD